MVSAIFTTWLTILYRLAALLVIQVRIQVLAKFFFCLSFFFHMLSSFIPHALLHKLFSTWYVRLRLEKKRSDYKRTRAHCELVYVQETMVLYDCSERSGRDNDVSSFKKGSKPRRGAAISNLVNVDNNSCLTCVPSLRLLPLFSTVQERGVPSYPCVQSYPNLYYGTSSFQLSGERVEKPEWRSSKSSLQRRHLTWFLCPLGAQG